MDTYAQIAQKIIEQQETIIGPVAIEQAKMVEGLQIDWDKHKVTVNGDKTKVIDRLVEQYRHLFGRTSVEVCKEAAAGLLSNFPPDRVPSLLR